MDKQGTTMRGMKQMGEMLKKTLETIERYKGQNPHYQELLEILEEILILREAYRQKFRDDIFEVNGNHVKQKLSGGLPLVDLVGHNFDLSGPKGYFYDLLEIAKKRSPEETEKITEGLKNGSLIYEELVGESFIEDPELELLNEEEEKIFDLLSLFLEESLRPALEVTAEKYRDVIAESNWSEGYCPLCGRKPKIGELRGEGGQRYLFCNQCGSEWVFQRVKCPFCGNDDHTKLAYFTIEDEEKYRVDVCNQCNRYIKTVDFRKIEQKANLDIEDIATLHLDILANEEGYE